MRDHSRDRRERRSIFVGDGGNLARLEERIMLSHIPAAEVHITSKKAHAPKVPTVNMGEVSTGQDLNFSGSLARGKTMDYEFQVGSQLILDATLSGLSSNAMLSVLNNNRSILHTFSNGKANDAWDYTFAPGTYYARVEGLGPGKAKYHLEITTRAYPTPQPSTPATNTNSGSSGGSGNASSGSTSPPSGNSPSQTTTVNTPTTGGPVSGVTVGQLATALDQGIESSIKQFVLDSIQVEQEAPTLGNLAGSIPPITEGLYYLAKDYKSDDGIQALADLQTLGKVMLAEAQVVTSYNLPASDALIANPTIQSDLATINYFKEWTYVFLVYIGEKTGRTLVSPANAVLSTGALPEAQNTSQYQRAVSGNTLNSLSTYSTPNEQYQYNYFMNYQAEDSPGAPDVFSDYDTGPNSSYNSGTG